MNEIIEVEALADMHTHLREGEVTAPLIANAIAGGADVLGIMPNTAEGLKTAAEVDSYIRRARGISPPDHQMTFIPFVMITELTTERDIYECVEKGIVDGKVYPYMRTTKSTHGVGRYGGILQIVKWCGKAGMKVHFHPEHPSLLFNNRDAEFAFLPIVEIFLEETEAIIIWEHGTDARCIPHWEGNAAQSGRLFVTLTAHHLATNEDRAFGDVRSVCKPPIKTEVDRQGLVDLVAKDYKWVMAGGDSAFHDTSAKHVEQGCCACGAYTAPFLLQLYAHALDEMLMRKENGVRTFKNFISRNARSLHHLPESSRVIKLSREQWKIPLSYPMGQQTATPFWAGQFLNWKIVG